MDLLRNIGHFGFVWDSQFLTGFRRIVISKLVVVKQLQVFVTNFKSIMEPKLFGIKSNTIKKLSYHLVFLEALRHFSSHERRVNIQELWVDLSVMNLFVGYIFKIKESLAKILPSLSASTPITMKYEKSLLWVSKVAIVLNCLKQI